MHGISCGHFGQMPTYNLCLERVLLTRLLHTHIPDWSMNSQNRVNRILPYNTFCESRPVQKELMKNDFLFPFFPVSSCSLGAVSR